VILVAGASGAVGSALMATLLAQPAGERRPLRAFVRREFDAVRLRDRGVEAVVGDLVDGRGVDPAMRGVRTLVYLVQTVGRGGDVVANDLEAARNTTLAARAAGVERIIFLGHVAASPEAPARQLVARWAVERALGQSGITCTVLRAPVIVGRGAEPFELATLLARRLPLVPLFAWRRARVEPVALADVVEALTMALEDTDLDGRSFDICGPERMTVSEMVHDWARLTRRRRMFVPVPGEDSMVSGSLSWALARRHPRRSRLLLETFRAPQLCTDPSRRFPLPHRPLPYRQAVLALRGSPTVE
jgi:uncharacterized protein YbjT (DUF2867 family)